MAMFLRAGHLRLLPRLRLAVAGSTPLSQWGFGTGAGAVGGALLPRTYCASAKGGSANPMATTFETTVTSLATQPAIADTDKLNEEKSTVTITITVPRTASPTDAAVTTVPTPPPAEEWATKTSLEVLSQGMTRLELKSMHMEEEVRALTTLIGQGHTPLAMQVIMENIRPVAEESAEAVQARSGSWTWADEKIVRLGAAVECTHLERIVAAYRKNEKITNTIASKIFTIDSTKYQLVATTTPHSEKEPNRRLFLGLYSDMDTEWREAFHRQGETLKLMVVATDYSDEPTDKPHVLMSFKPKEVNNDNLANTPSVLPTKCNSLDYQSHVVLGCYGVSDLEDAISECHDNMPSAFWAYWDTHGDYCSDSASECGSDDDC